MAEYKHIDFKWRKILLISINKQRKSFNYSDKKPIPFKEFSEYKDFPDHRDCRFSEDSGAFKIKYIKQAQINHYSPRSIAV